MTRSTASAASREGATTTSRSPSCTRSSSRACAPSSAGRPARAARSSVRDLAIDLAARTVRVGGERVQLSAKEYDLLVALAEDPERVFRKEDLLRNVWGFRSLGRTRTLDSHASRLRRKLNADGDCAYVLNVWGVGYRLVASSTRSPGNDCVNPPSGEAPASACEHRHVGRPSRYRGG